MKEAGSFSKSYIHHNTIQEWDYIVGTDQRLFYYSKDLSRENNFSLGRIFVQFGGLSFPSGQRQSFMLAQVHFWETVVASLY